MVIVYSDQEIESLVREHKPLPVSGRNQFRLKPKRSYFEKQFDLSGQDGNKFRIILRQNSINPLNFSVILAVIVPSTTQLFRLRRYNGKSHEHTNVIENEKFFGYHIHFATERYQEAGSKEDAYAQKTNRYCDFDGAVQCLIDDVNLKSPFDAQSTLF